MIVRGAVRYTKESVEQRVVVRGVSGAVSDC